MILQSFKYIISRSILSNNTGPRTWNRRISKQDHQALPKAKYCPRVAAHAHRKYQKTHVTLTFDR